MVCTIHMSVGSRKYFVDKVMNRFFILVRRSLSKADVYVAIRFVPSCLASRIPVRENRDPRYFADKYQGIPKYGYTSMMANMLDHPNISVMTNTDFFALQQYIERTFTVYTGKLDEYFGKRYGELDYRSVRFEFETVDEERHQPVSVVNYPNDYDFTRITEFKHFTGEKSGKTTLCREYPSAKGDPCYVVLTKENLEKRKKYLAEADRVYREEHCVFLGRLAEYRYYNMDQAIEAVITGLDAIRASSEGYTC